MSLPKDKELLEDYSKEIGYPHILDVAELIASHRYLRNKNVDNIEIQQKIIESARIEAYTHALDYAKKNDMIRLQELEKLDLLQIAELLGFNR